MRETNRERIRRAVDECLSGMDGRPSLEKRVLARAKGERRGPRRLSLALAVALLVTLLAAATLAAGVLTGWLRLRQEDEYLDSLAAAYLTELKTEAGAVTLPCAAVAQAPAVLKPRVLRLALDALGAGKKDFTAAHYDALAALCAGSGTAQLDLPGGVTAEVARQELCLRNLAPFTGAALLLE